MNNVCPLGLEPRLDVYKTSSLTISRQAVKNWD